MKSTGTWCLCAGALGVVFLAASTALAGAPLSGVTIGAELDNGTFGICQGHQGGRQPAAAPAAWLVVQTNGGVTTERWWMNADSTVPIGDQWQRTDLAWTFHYVDTPMPLDHLPSPVGATWDEVVGTYTVPTTTVLKDWASGNDGAGTDVLSNRLRHKLAYKILESYTGGSSTAYAYTTAYTTGTPVTGTENWSLLSGWMKPGSQSGDVTWTIVPGKLPGTLIPTSTTFHTDTGAAHLTGAMSGTTAPIEQLDAAHRTPEAYSCP